ncbi:hypothetical protein Tco_0926334 [Tanacetum coccineum]|uniref:Uncharacterized protein n=1 Tax=Tanacetum coccineum TaxID=301880 RepID=A0ABQ5D9I8_9ASTR
MLSSNSEKRSTTEWQRCLDFLRNSRTAELQIRGPMHDASLKKKIPKRRAFGGNFEIPCNVGELKHTDALVDQGFDVNVMPLSIYNKLTYKRPAETDIRLSLASHSFIYPLGIAEDVLVEVAGYVYLVDFMILDIKEDKNALHLRNTILDYT